MALKDNFLIEDMGDVADHLENLLKTCLDAQDCALKGNFVHNNQFLKDISHSLNVLEALNKKKIKRDEQYYFDKNYESFRPYF